MEEVLRSNSEALNAAFANIASIIESAGIGDKVETITIEVNGCVGWHLKWS